jgi:hypothetical protein
MQTSSHISRMLKVILSLGASLTLAACDPEGKKNCDWVLEPEAKLSGTTDEGFIPVCARNRHTNKEDCRLQTSLEYAEKVYGRKFRYVDMRVERLGLPRTIGTIKFCDRGS